MTIFFMCGLVYDIYDEIIRWLWVWILGMQIGWDYGVVYHICVIVA